MKLAAVNGEKTTYYNQELVKALQFFPVAKTIAYRLILPIIFMCHHDQNWMFLETSPKYQYVPESLLSSSGHKKTQGARDGFTHCATALQNLLTGEMMVGPGAIIIPSATKDGAKSYQKQERNNYQNKVVHYNWV